MNAIKRAGLFLASIGVLTAVLCGTLYLDNRKETVGAVLSVGAGDDITGLFMEDLAGAAKDTNLHIELTTFMDCCGSSAQWAMTSDNLDAGFYCGSIALTLLNHNSELEIYGPVVLNAEVVALSCDKEEVRTMAVPMKRSFLNDIVYSNFPCVEEILQAPTTSLHYAFSGDNVDGAVVDIAKALKAPDFGYVPLSDDDHVSYCLVVNKRVLDTPQFAEFLDAYNRTAYKYNDIEYLESRYDMGDSFWQTVNVQFLYLD